MCFFKRTESKRSGSDRGRYWKRTENWSDTPDTFTGSDRGTGEKYKGIFITLPSLFKLFNENTKDISLLLISLNLVKLLWLIFNEDLTSIGIIIFLFWITKSISFLLKV